MKNGDEVMIRGELWRVVIHTGDTLVLDRVGDDDNPCWACKNTNFDKCGYCRRGYDVIS